MELPLQAVTLCTTLFHVLDMNTALMDPEGSVHLLHERDSLPDFLLELQHGDYTAIGRESLKYDGACCMYTNSWGLSYMSQAFRIGTGEEHRILLGPFLKQVPDLTEIVPSVEQSRYVQLQEFYRGLKLISTSKIQSIANVLEHTGCIRQAPLYNIAPAPSFTGERKTGSPARVHVSEQASSELIELRYQLETELMHAVQKGDRALIQEMSSYTKNMFDFTERFPNQPLRALRNMLIVLNTLLRIAARNGKVHPVYLHQLSEKFSKQIERSDSIDALDALIGSMYDEYCFLVKRRSVTGYSPLVQQAMQYMTVHMTAPLDLQSLADVCHVHPSHLSRQFKKETSLTLTEFLNRQRIDEAKLLLAKERASIDWIAGYVGFEDAAYFARVFKKLEGMTPTQYRAEKAQPAAE